MKNKLTTLFAAGLALSLSSGVSADETTYRNQIQPLFEAKCSPCHGGDAAPEHAAFKEKKEHWLAQGKGMRMDTYSHLVGYTAWPDTGALMRRLDDGQGQPGGKPGNMYLHLGDTEEERQRNLGTFKAWVGNWTLKRWKEISKEELNAIQVKY
ncbi:MAG TPA: hypothetical protein VLA15_05425 [Desulfurivibrionaceae bacterium]|nr:hypothetical protein [Desulfurivibrionaceae bacterium]